MIVNAHAKADHATAKVTLVPFFTNNYHTL